MCEKIPQYEVEISSVFVLAVVSRNCHSVTLQKHPDCAVSVAETPTGETIGNFAS